MLLCMSDHCSAHIEYRLFGLYAKMRYTTIMLSVDEDVTLSTKQIIS